MAGLAHRFKILLRQAIHRVIQHTPGLNRLIRQAVRFVLAFHFDCDTEPLKSLLAQSRTGIDILRQYRRTPRISILLPVYNTRPEDLTTCLNSVLSQIYCNWELCIVDDASPSREVGDLLKAFAQRNPRIKLAFSAQNAGICKTINKAAAMATGSFIGVLDHDDELAPAALLEYIRVINAHPDADLIYCDEDKIDMVGNYCLPWFKSDWNPDLALSFNYVMHFALYRTRLFTKLGGVDDSFEGSQDFDLLLRATELTDKIFHIPKILYHWRIGKGSIADDPGAKPYVFDSGIAALQQAIQRRGIRAAAEHDPEAWPGIYRVRREIGTDWIVSIIIAFKGNWKGLARLLDSLARFGSAGRHEILLCSAGCTPPDRTFFENHGVSGIQFVNCALNDSLPNWFNQGVSQASGEYLFFLDDTFELLNAESLSGLLEHAGRSEIGAAGGKIYHADGRIEHCGVILGPFGLLGYAHRATPESLNCNGMKNMICNYSAVMGLGMMTRKAVFNAANGFDEMYKNAYWDVDYCLRLGENGLRTVYTPYAHLKHHIPVKSIDEMIVEPEAAIFRQKWRHIIDNDPFFNPNFSRGLENFSYTEAAYSLGKSLC